MPTLSELIDQIAAGIKQIDGTLRQSGAPPDVLGALETLNREMDAAQEHSAQVTEELRQLQQLVQTSALLTSALDLDHVLEKVVDAVIKLTGAERAYLMLRDKTSGSLTIRAARSWEQESLLSEAISFSQGIIEAAIEQKECIITTNVSDSRVTTFVNTGGKTIRAILCIPLSLRQQTVGALYADRRLKIGMFSPDIISVLTAFANQAAIAIENARLFEKARAELLDAQQRVQRIQIQIDPMRADDEINAIANTDFFRRIQEAMRGADEPDNDS